MYEEHEDGSFTLHMCEWYEQGRLSLELRLVSVVHRRIASAEHFLAGEPRTIVVV